MNGIHCYIILKYELNNHTTIPFVLMYLKLQNQHALSIPQGVSQILQWHVLMKRKKNVEIF